MQYRSRIKLYLGLLYGGGTVTAIGMLLETLNSGSYFFTAISVIGLLISGAGLIVAASGYRCPGCGTKIKLRKPVASFCPRCGRRL